MAVVRNRCGPFLMAKLDPTPSRADATLTVLSRTWGTVATLAATHYVCRQVVTVSVAQNADAWSLQCQADWSEPMTSEALAVSVIRPVSDCDKVVVAGMARDATTRPGSDRGLANLAMENGLVPKVRGALP
jgi:hypothetical protein